MCGIFGVTLGENSSFPVKAVRRSIDDLFRLSESRGKEAAGIALLNREEISFYKTPIPASRMIKMDSYKNLLERHIASSPAEKNGAFQDTFAIIGHSRLVTNGAQMVYENNQPVVTSGAVGVHNGIVVNHENLWSRFSSLRRRFEVDTEVIFSLLKKFVFDGDDLVAATGKTFDLIEGAASVAVLFDNIDALLLATNNGSLYICKNEGRGALFFASEEYILKMLARKAYLQPLIGSSKIDRVNPGTGCVVDMHSLKVEPFVLSEDRTFSESIPRAAEPRGLRDVRPTEDLDAGVAGETLVSSVAIPESVLKRVAYDHSLIRNLRRCTRCILPETMPFIQFDEAGVCNFCREHSKKQVFGLDILKDKIAPFRREGGRLDCIVNVSGGRDSTYGLHFVKTVLGMEPIAYTYDWGMITDLARRNISRICGKLGIEHILISADINRKRKNIRRNVLAWLRRPALGMVPLFMAGDKQYLYYSLRLRKQTGIDLIFTCANGLEKTYFKSGFAGVLETPKQPGDMLRAYDISLMNKTKVLCYHAKEFLQNPLYLNRSLWDSLWAFYSAYVKRHNFLFLFEYIKWDEEEIISTLRREYDWEMAADTSATWRIGDGTAAFYNYIYYTGAGFTENDTFVSNMIREDMITREKAFEIAQGQNTPRYEAIKWYCDIIGVDFEYALKTINSMPKLYSS
jgi:hypothetical protein